MTERILDVTGYKQALKESKTLEDQGRLENLQEFLSVTMQFDRDWQPQDEQSDPFVDFLADLALVSDQDSDEQTTDEVTLMTLHAAKGLEFPVVFLVGMEEGIFPLGRANFDENELEEERRLAYVGITRAKEELFLTNAYSRMLYGKSQNNTPSRFIAEIDQNLIKLAAKTATQIPFSSKRFDFKKPYQQSKQTIVKSKTTQVPKETWQVGDKVKHKAWGLGTVVKANGKDEDLELDIAFDGQGIKRVLATFAPITKA